MALLAVLQFSKTQRTDWRKNFDPNEKSPFGLFIFAQEAPKLLSPQLRKIDRSPYEYFSDKKNSATRNILMIEKVPDPESAAKILNEVKKGSDFMLISTQIYGSIIDSLEIGQVQSVNFEEENTLKLTDVTFQNDSLNLTKFPGRNGFKMIGKDVQILGTTNWKNKSFGTNFIKIKYGKGNLYFHTEPLFLTNYYLLKSGNEKYAEDVFSYLPERQTIWFKDGNTIQSGNILRFVFANPPLKYAWWTLIAGILLFIFFNAKRKQRIIPIIEPLKNKSLEFVKSIGNLYLQEGDFHDMMAKKAQYFLYKVRLDFLIDTQNPDEEFAKKLQLKTGKDIAKINEAISLIKKGTDPYANVTKEDLVRMNFLLDDLLK